MNSTPDDCRLYIRSYLIWPESCNMSIVFRMEPDYTLRHTYNASVIVRRSQRRLAAYKELMHLFVDRCVNNVAYRSKYLFIHQTHDPHICFRNIPRWISKNPYRFHIRTFLTMEQEALMHTYINTIVEISTI